MKKSLLLGLVLAAAAWPRIHGAAFDLQYESATSPEGPWRPVTAAEVLQHADGSVVFEGEGVRFFRLRIQGDGPARVPSVVRLGTLPAATAQRLTTRTTELGRFLRPLVTTEGDDTVPRVQEPLEGFAGVAAWQGATFANNAIPIYDPAYLDGKEPAYVEIKVSSPGRGIAKGRALEGSTREQDFHRGSILLSLSEGDVTIPFFSTDGETPAERLVAQLGLMDAAGRRILTPPAGHKVMRYGPTFHVLENAAGESVASLGTQPFKIPSDLLRRFPNGDRGNGTPASEEPARQSALGQALGFGHYESYAEFKKDYLSNDAYRVLRERRALRAKVELDAEAGRLPQAPEVVRVAVGASADVLAGVTVESYFLDDDDADLGVDPFVTVTRLRTGGLRITAVRSGDGELVVRAGRSLVRFYVTVPLRIVRPIGVASAGSFVPGWQEPRVWDAGGYDEQPRYWQESRDRWCPKVGCGPVAWAILFAWWDRRGVPSAFAVGTGSALRTSLRTKDAPLYLDQDDDPSGYNRVIKMYDVVHDSCDVICNPFGEAGATAPGDMVEAWWEPTKWGRRTDATGVYFPYPTVPPNPVMGYWYSYSWDLMDPDWNEPSNVIRKANKKGRPAIVGLGWLWHYGVSYAYRYQEFKATADGPPLLIRRWFRVNEGWGKDHGEWYSGGDTFLGFDLKLTQRHIPPPL